MKKIIIITLCFLIGILFSIRVSTKSTAETEQQTHLQANIGLSQQARDELNKILP